MNHKSLLLKTGKTYILSTPRLFSSLLLESLFFSFLSSHSLFGINIARFSDFIVSYPPDFSDPILVVRVLFVDGQTLLQFKTLWPREKKNLHFYPFVGIDSEGEEKHGMQRPDLSKKKKAQPMLLTRKQSFRRVLLAECF